MIVKHKRNVILCPIVNIVRILYIREHILRREIRAEYPCRIQQTCHYLTHFLTRQSSLRKEMTLSVTAYQSCIIRHIRESIIRIVKRIF